MGQSFNFFKFERFLRDLKVTNPDAFIELNESDIFILSAILDASKLSMQELSFLMGLYIKYGNCPEIQIRNFEETIPKYNSFRRSLENQTSDYLSDALAYSAGPVYSSRMDWNKIGRDISVSVTLYRPNIINRSRLMEDLLRAEKEEDYRLCSAIMNCAKENGIDLKRGE